MICTLTLDEIVEVTGGALVDGPEKGNDSGEETCHFVSTDTRTLRPNSLFVALRGETHDGHAYLEAAQNAGAIALVVDHALGLGEAHLPHVVVPDTLRALGDIARDVRDCFPGPVIGVTGSIGKTTTKELIAHVLSAQFSVHKSELNHNNEIGVPQTLFGLEETHTACVIEMGMRGPGQIRRLAEIAAPTIGVVTNVGLSHVELLGSPENIALAKAELFELLPHDGSVAVYPADDPFAALLREHFKGEVALTCALETPGAGTSPAVGTPADLRASDISLHENGYRFTVSSPWGTQKMFLPSPGRFNVLNALFAVAVAGQLGVPLDVIGRQLLRWTAPPMRLEVLTSAEGVTVLSDAYNAAPDSMRGALETLRDTQPKAGGKRIAVIGEMRELGEVSSEAHAIVGRAAAHIKPDMLILIGEMTRKSAAAALAAGFPLDNLHQFDTTSEAVGLVPFIVQPGDVVLVKGSRAMAMEQIVDAIMKRAPDAAPAAPIPSSSAEAGAGA